MHIPALLTRLSGTLIAAGHPRLGSVWDFGHASVIIVRRSTDLG